MLRWIAAVCKIAPSSIGKESVKIIHKSDPTESVRFWARKQFLSVHSDLSRAEEQDKVPFRKSG